MPTRTQVGRYYAVTDRLVYPKPPLPALGPAGTTIADPVFGSLIRRVTDTGADPAFPATSFRTPSNHHAMGWSSDGTRFLTIESNGTLRVYRFDPIHGTCTPDSQQPLFQNEPTFSRVSPGLLYGTSAAGSLTTADQFDCATGAWTLLLDLATVGAPPNTYVDLVTSSAAPERLAALYGGAQQDLHNLVVVWDKSNPANRHVLNTQASTIDGAAVSPTLGFLLHHIAIDRSGRYVTLYPVNGQPYQSCVWDTVAGTFTPLLTVALPYGHDSHGYGVSINHDCGQPYDGLQWQLRTLASPQSPRPLLQTLLTPEETYVDDHSSWNTVTSANAEPFLTAIYRFGDSLAAPWRPLDDELVAVAPNMPGTDPTIWRFAHHRIDQRSDTDPASSSYLYQPIPQVSPDGNWCLLDSNWEKTLGVDPSPGDPSAAHRTDVFLVQLAGSAPPSAPSLANAITTLQAALAELNALVGVRAVPEVGGIAGPAALGFHAGSTGE